MNLKNWGIPALIAGVIIIGLILRYGQSTNYALSDIFNGGTAWIKALSLSNQTGNNPSGASLIKTS